MSMIKKKCLNRAEEITQSWLRSWYCAQLNNFQDRIYAANVEKNQKLPNAMKCHMDKQPQELSIDPNAIAKEEMQKWGKVPTQKKTFDFLGGWGCGITWSKIKTNPMATSLPAPQTRPSNSMERTSLSISAMSVSSSHGFTSNTIDDLAITVGFFDFFSW